ncbi:hypothetical protein MycrhDRAFT_5684 [Mycolicibacterium rhodesiae JS60]|nr:hypothetical protein MycrhDRAFT_5684 [Mycolicibacterium rhodesiae JS60]
MSVPAVRMAAVSEESTNYVQHAPRRRTEAGSVADFTMLVRVPGEPAAVRVFTDAETDEADRYAAGAGGTVVPLPLDPSAATTPNELEETGAGLAAE